MALGDDVKELREELKALRSEVQDLRRFQAWVMGAIAGIGVVVGIFINDLKARLGLR